MGLRILIASLIIALLTPNLAWAQCINPAGVKGEIVFNADFKTPQYCDDSNWVAMTGANPIPTNGLVGYWSMDSISGTTVMDDSGNGNDGTWLSDDSPATVKTVPGVRGNAVSFDSSDDAIRIGQDPDFDMSGTNAFTISAWVRPNSTIGGNKAIFTRGLVQTGASGTPYNLYHVTNGRWAGQISDGATIFGINDFGFTPSIEYDQWVHLTITWDGAYHKMYKNGTLIGSINRPGFTLWDTSTVRREVAIGAAVNTALVLTNTFDGLIDEVYFFNRALSLDEIGNLYLTTDHAIGYFVMIGNQPTSAEANEFDGDLGGMSGANATCLSYLTTYDWLGKNIAEKAGYLTADNVRAWLCDNSICNQLAADTQYAVATTEAGKESSAGAATFVTDGSGLYPASDTRVWSAENYFDRTTYFWTGRAVDFSASGNSCSGWTTTSGSGERGGLTTASDSQRWSGGTQSCSTTDQFVCMVNTNSGSKGSIRYNETERAPEFYDGNKFVPMRPDFPDVTEGLVGHWKLDETTGTTAVDSSSNGNDGTYSGITADSASTLGAIGRAGIFVSPAAAMVSIPDSPELSISGEISFSLWYMNNPLSAVNQILSKGFWDYQIEQANSDLLLKRDNGTNEASVNYSFSPNQWYHIVITYDETSMEVEYFVNGALVGTATKTDAIIAGSQSLTLARNNANKAKGLDDVRIYDRILSASEVATLYAMGSPAGPVTALPQGCPTIGDVCDDGTIYAGLSPDGNVAMFTAPADEAGTFQWGSFGTLRGTGSTPDGDGNTLLLAGFGASAHPPAHQCFTKMFGGADDWYLPARPELDVLYNSGNPVVAGLDLSGTRYWSSSEHAVDGNSAQATAFDAPTTFYVGKNASYLIRCVRKGPAPRCANPYGLEGAFLYNDDHSVVQYCDGARWIAIGKRAP